MLYIRGMGFFWVLQPVGNIWWPEFLLVTEHFRSLGLVHLYFMIMSHLLQPSWGWMGILWDWGTCHHPGLVPLSSATHHLPATVRLPQGRAPRWPVHHMGPGELQEEDAPWTLLQTRASRRRRIVKLWGCWLSGISGMYIVHVFYWWIGSEAHQNGDRHLPGPTSYAMLHQGKASYHTAISPQELP